MVICFLAPANSAHIIKWCNYFTTRGHEVHVISFVNDKIPGTSVHFIDCGAEGDSSDLKKINYLFRAKKIRRLVEEISPDIVNVHYATSYGAVAALSGLKGYILSVWGSDIFSFPLKSPLHKALLKFSLNRADYLFSTSRAMADEAGKYTEKEFEITPFGVDMELFSPDKRKRNDDDFIVGTVKSLACEYGIDYLIKAVSLVRKEHPEIPVKLRIAGKGPEEISLKNLAKDKGIDDITTWLGFISQEEAAGEWANFDLAVVYSVSESFGVSAVEAESCMCPVIISDLPGLMEATSPGITSLVVPVEDEKKLAEAIYTLYLDESNRSDMGKKGREFVKEHYEYHRCFEKIERLFESIRTS